ncbi:hypothetical protein LIER_15940 [Lithospermum erythrorhizon]|uniref:Uncharacterized protein n=1 Tax=Lithospermum erythrorhizon TaxID=34254 RepID=A0AAV3Q679_LITER
MKSSCCLRQNLRFGPQNKMQREMIRGVCGQMMYPRIWVAIFPIFTGKGSIQPCPGRVRRNKVVTPVSMRKTKLAFLKITNPASDRTALVAQTPTVPTHYTHGDRLGCLAIEAVGWFCEVSSNPSFGKKAFLLGE